MLTFKLAFFLEKEWELKYTPADRAQFTPMKLLSEASGHKHVILPGQEVASRCRELLTSGKQAVQFRFSPLVQLVQAVH